MLEDVQESDEGEYIVRNTSNPRAVQHLILLVRGKTSPALVGAKPHFCFGFGRLNARVMPQSHDAAVNESNIWVLATLSNDAETNCCNDPA